FPVPQRLSVSFVCPVYNAGTFGIVNAGVLIAGNGRSTPRGRNRSWVLGDGCTLTFMSLFNSYQWDTGTTFEGTGQVYLMGKAWIPRNVGVTAENFNFVFGTLDNDGTFDINRQFNWLAGTLKQAATSNTNIKRNGSLGGLLFNTLTMDGGNLNIQGGTVNFYGATLEMANGATLTNAAGTFDILGDSFSNIRPGAGGAPQIVNAGGTF